MTRTILRHVVLFAVLEGVDSADVDEAIADMEALTDTGQVLDLTVGHDVSGRGDFHVGLCADFASREHLDRYLEHPQHQRLVHQTLPAVFSRPWQVVDFYTLAADQNPGVARAATSAHTGLLARIDTGALPGPKEENHHR